MDQQNLLRQMRIYDAIFEQAPIGIAISFNADVQPAEGPDTFRINPMYEKITGRSKEELRRVGWASITHPDDIEENLRYYKRFLAGEINGYAMEKRFIRPDGSIIWVHMTVTRLIFGETLQLNHVSLIQDITESKRAEAQLKYDSDHDRWTGLLNRSSLERLLVRHVQRTHLGRRILISVNLSSVQMLTSSYGFHYTQDLMKRVALAMYALCSESCLLFNTFENRFVFYITHAPNQTQLMHFCETIKGILGPILVPERVDAGLGVIEVTPQNETDIDQLLKKLLIASEKSLAMTDQDFACCVFDETMEEEIRREEQIKDELECIAADPYCRSFYLEYQPILHTLNHEICGFEALSRLRSPVLGQISPVEFIPIAERSKLIVPIGWHVLRRAFEFSKKIERLGFTNISISVNISAIQLLRADFVPLLKELVEKTKVDPQVIGLEITESIFVANEHEVNHILKQLQEEGFHVAIDDFGTGYSSLAREQELHVDSLKIDKYFLRKLKQEAPEQSVLSEMISIAKKMGHCVVAEGVENEFQLKYLLQHGCDQVQGYFFAGALKEEEAIQMLYDKSR